MPTPLIYAHRGASAWAPENTIAAFLLAAEQGADGIELDVKLSRDGKVIVLHDLTLNRTSNGSGTYLSHSLADLRRLDFGSWFSDRYAGERIPTLAEVFEAVSGKMGINIELTNYANPADDLVAEVAKVLRGLNNTSRVMFSSFNPQNLRKAKFLCPAIPCGLLAFPGWKGWFTREITSRTDKYAALHPFYRDVTPWLVQNQHRSGRQVNVWTVNDPQIMLNCEQMGIDMLMTDDPQLARKTLGGEK